MKTQKMLQIGNSAGILIPMEWRQELGMVIGQEVALEKKGKTITVKPYQSKKKKYANGVTPEFAKMVDRFMQEHKDVLEELSRR